jgi:hypothetical protein
VFPFFGPEMIEWFLDWCRRREEVSDPDLISGMHPVVEVIGLEPCATRTPPNVEEENNE